MGASVDQIEAIFQKDDTFNDSVMYEKLRFWACVGKKRQFLLWSTNRIETYSISEEHVHSHKIKSN